MAIRIAVGISSRIFWGFLFSEAYFQNIEIFREISTFYIDALSNIKDIRNTIYSMHRMATDDIS